MAGNSTEPGRSVTSKVAAILMSFTNGRGHALVDLARQAGLPTSTAHRLSRELVDRHLLERTDDGEFRVGLGAEGVVLDGLDAAAVGEAVARARPDTIVNQMTALSPAHAGRVGLRLAALGRLRRSHTGRVTPEPPPSLRDPDPPR